MVWTRFMDMHAGGIRNTEYEVIYIELPEDEAVEYFEKEFDTDPLRSNCSCCGSNYSISEEEKPESKYDDKPIRIISKSELSLN